MPNRTIGGWLPPIADRPRIAFARISAAPPYPSVCDNTTGLSFGMDFNDEWGDCVPAGWEHVRMVIRALLGEAHADALEAEILALYRTQNPQFDPNGDPSTTGPGSPADGGMVVQLLLEYLVKHGQILAFAAVDFTNDAEVDAAIHAGGALVGAAVLTERNVTHDTDVKLWDADPSGQQVGGHCFGVGGYSTITGRRRIITWGEVLDATTAFVHQAFQELWWVLLPEQATAGGGINGVNEAALAAEYTAITGKPFPVTPPAPPVPVPPAPVPGPPAPVPPAPVPPTPDPSGGASFPGSTPAVDAYLARRAARRSMSSVAAYELWYWERMAGLPTSERAAFARREALD